MILKRFSYILIIAFVSFACSQDKSNTNKCLYSTNQLKLLCNDSLAPNTHYNLLDIREDVFTKLDLVFDDFYCRQVKLKVDFYFDSLQSIKTLLHISNHTNCEDKAPPPPFNPYVHWIRNNFV